MALASTAKALPWCMHGAATGYPGIAMSAHSVHGAATGYPGIPISAHRGAMEDHAIAMTVARAMVRLATVTHGHAMACAWRCQDRPWQCRTWVATGLP